MSAFLKFIGRISDWSGRLFAWLIVPLIGALVYEVVMRYVFDAPTVWAFDISYMLYGTLYMMGVARNILIEGNIRVDFLYRRLPPHRQALIDFSLYLLFFFPGVILLLIYGIDYARCAWEIKERTSLSPWRPPIYPLKTVIPVAAFLILLQGIADFVQKARIVLRGRGDVA